MTKEPKLYNHCTSTQHSTKFTIVVQRHDRNSNGHYCTRNYHNSDQRVVRFRRQSFQSKVFLLLGILSGYCHWRFIIVQIIVKFIVHVIVWRINLLLFPVIIVWHKLRLRILCGLMWPIVVSENINWCLVWSTVS